MKTDQNTLYDAVADTLRSFHLRKSYADEQRDLQPHLREEIDFIIASRFGSQLQTVISVGGSSPKPSIKALGTSFWPDIEIAEGDRPILGIEVKIIRADKSASKPLAETIGQSLLYCLRYPRVIAFVLHLGKDDDRLNDKTIALQNLLEQNNIELIVRKG